MLVGLPLALDYVVRPGDTLSEIAERHDTTVGRIIARNDLHRSGDRIVAGQSLTIPGRHATKRKAHRPARHRRISPDKRRIVSYTVRPGDTPSGLAVRFHAWTAELIERNGSVLRVGERIEIPVVVAAAAKARRERAHQTSRSRAHDSARHGSSRPEKKRSNKKQSTRPGKKHATHPRKHRPHRARHDRPSRARVRRVVAATARRHGVDPQLALAVSWQESGWQMHRRSSAGAIGAMQVMPATGRWMSTVIGRPLHLRDLQDNATAGVVLLGLLQNQARLRVAVAGYYQGLAGVRRHGMYDDSRRYVANVLALRSQLERGRYPA
jgi:LysM repeat protein